MDSYQQPTTMASQLNSSIRGKLKQIKSKYPIDQEYRKQPRKYGGKGESYPIPIFRPTTRRNCPVDLLLKKLEEPKPRRRSLTNLEHTRLANRRTASCERKVSPSKYYETTVRKRSCFHLGQGKKQYVRRSSVNDVAIDQKKANNRLKLSTIEVSLFRPDQRCFKGKERHKQRNELGEYVSGFGLQPQFYRLETEYAKQRHLVHKSGKGIRKEDQGTGQAFKVIPALPTETNLTWFVQSYRSLGKQIDVHRLMKLPNFQICYSKTQLYFGEVEGADKEGLGILITTKLCFQGFFRQNQKDRGFQMDIRGIYRGEYGNDKREGNGQYEGVNGDYYVGDWDNDEHHGNGFWSNRQGDSYQGKWKHGKANGYGLLIAEGRQHRGHFVDSVKEGWGREKLGNGDIYEGEFEGDVPHRKGVYLWANGTRYEGQFERGFRLGRGILSTLDGYSYKGTFIDEVAEGLCEIVYPNGDLYSGQFKNGKKNGKGTLTSQGHRLEGYWTNDVLLGPLGCCSGRLSQYAVQAVKQFTKDYSLQNYN